MSFRYHFSRFIASFLPDKLYLSIKFRINVGYWMNWKNPQTFDEKLQWLKIYYKRDDYTQLVDKIRVKDFVRSKIGENYVIPTLKIYENANDIDFTKLPNNFVLKCTHDSGGIIVCTDKTKLNEIEAKKKLNRYLNRSYVRQNREYPYKKVPHKIIAEPYLVDPEYGELRDFKIYCFDGIPKYILVASGRQKGQKRFDYFDLEWNHLPVYDEGCPNADITPTKPINLDDMISIAKVLSAGMPHVRVDLYNIHGLIYFGELTFFDGSGVTLYVPREYDRIFGSYLNLPARL